MASSAWRAQRNAKALVRLERSLLEIFPAPVLLHALARPFIPPTPRRAVESYWRHHPVRADKLARALAARSGPPHGWVWRIGSRKSSGRPLGFRAPPAPFRDEIHAKGPGHCCVCGQPVFRFGWHRDLWGDGRPNRIMFRGGPYGGDNDYARRREREHGPFPEHGPDEGLLMGARNIEPVNGGGDWTVVKPEHWMFEGTGMKKGERIPGLIGWEYHGDPPTLPGLEIVAAGTAWVGGQVPQKWTATIYPGPRANFVFNAATIFWAQGLSSPPGHTLPWSHWSRPHGPDERVQRITHNLLRRAIGRGS